MAEDGEDGHTTPTTDLAALTCIIPQASSLKPVVLQGRFGDRQVSMLVDTGAAVSIVHKSMVAHEDKILGVPLPPIRVSVANNTPLRIEGAVDARTQVGGID